MIPVSPEADVHQWRRFVRVFLVTAAATIAGLSAIVLFLDPYGILASPGPQTVALMDINQRYMYPQVARSRLYDGAVFGTSTMRLIEPRALGTLFGARVANLAMNAATPWEQSRLIDLYLRSEPAPTLLVVGLDRTWCEADADKPDKRLTVRSFPAWLYGDHPAAAPAELLNAKTVEIAARVALNRLGLMRERIRQDGYEVFTPPEASYDLARAQAHIWTGATGGRIAEAPAVALTASERAALAFPALAWLDKTAARVPRTTRQLFVLPPIHVAAQARPGSREAAVDAACKTRIATIGAQRGATVVDFRFASPITREDANYWDNLHYRLPIAGRVTADLKAAVETGKDGADGGYRILRGP